jgi:hypothetical protein
MLATLQNARAKRSRIPEAHQAGFGLDSAYHSRESIGQWCTGGIPMGLQIPIRISAQ